MKKMLFVVTVLLIVALVGCQTPQTPTPIAPAESPMPSPEATSEPTDEPMPTSTPMPPTLEPEDEAEAYPVPDLDQEDYPAPPTLALPEGYPDPDEAGVESAADWVADGVIGEDEYDNQVTIDRVTVYWMHDGEYLYIAAEAEADGWISVGLNPEVRMQGADFIIAAHDGEPQIWDAYGQGETGPTHPPDTELGGTFDIMDYAVVYEDGWMLFEAQKPLDSGDAYDAVLVPGETYPIIVGIGRSHDFNATHVFRSHAGEMTLDE